MADAAADAAPAASKEESPEGDSSTSAPPAPRPSTPTKALGMPSLPPNVNLFSLYVGDLHPDATEATLHDHFSSAGEVASCRVCRDGATRRSLCYGYVNYFSNAHAERAIDTLNYTTILRRPCRVMWSQRDSAVRRNTSNNVFVRNLDPSIDNRILHDTFSVFGAITSCKVAVGPKGQSKGYGFVHYESEEAALLAIEKVNGMKIADRTVYVGKFVKREDLEGKQGEDAFTNLYVKHLPADWEDDGKVGKVFGEFGLVTSCVVIAGPEGKRFALVNFADSASAQKAIEALHGKDMRSDEAKSEKPDDGAGVDAKDLPEHCLYVQRALTKEERKAELDKEREKRKADKPSGVRLCVRNLPQATTVDELKALFEPHGTVVAAFLRNDDPAKKDRGALGFVIMSSMDEAVAAVEKMHLTVVGDQPIQVDLSQRRGQAGRGGGGADNAGGEAGDRGGRRGRRRDGKGDGKGEGGKGQRRDGGKAGGKGGAGGKGAGAAPGVPGQAGGPPLGNVYSLAPAVAGVPMPYGPPGALTSMPFPGQGVPPRPPPLMPGSPQHPQFPHMPFPLSPLGFPPSPAAYAQVAQATAQARAAALAAAAAQAAGTAPMMAAGALAPAVAGGAPPTPTVASGSPTAQSLARLHPRQQKQQLGEQLFAAISKLKPKQAGKITGMILELDNSEILMLLESASALKKKVDEAEKVLERQKPQ
eukprot:TRINITY_DN7822_c0_g3_i1.p1 TRINITY_DN7822_c0_g3~~TRINITY_DN7822_c0_g3_i1.p1  ORF type:complete len:703 (+),score=187.76 TRINITY_DN7822_c0_g3_i1:143-2251(+)